MRVTNSQSSMAISRHRTNATSPRKTRGVRTRTWKIMRPTGPAPRVPLEAERDEPGGDRAEEDAGSPVRLADRRHALHLQVVVLSGKQGDPRRFGVAGVLKPQAWRDPRQWAAQSVRRG
jgi:hypothetical protein